MAFVMAVLKQQRSKKERGHINQAAISPWLSCNRAESSTQEQSKQEIRSQLAALGLRGRTGCRAGLTGVLGAWWEQGAQHGCTHCLQPPRKTDEL